MTMDTASDLVAGALVDEHDPVVWCAGCGVKLGADDGIGGLCRTCQGELGGES